MADKGNILEAFLSVGPSVLDYLNPLPFSISDSFNSASSIELYLPLHWLLLNDCCWPGFMNQVHPGLFARM